MCAFGTLYVLVWFDYHVVSPQKAVKMDEANVETRKAWRQESMETGSMETRKVWRQEKHEDKETMVKRIRRSMVF